ncbi:MAG: hypothetical protein LUC95_09295 [Lachnospiraceae bacterium]|nr:hypothetical protein [Lachnospiraceae bacterium]
MDRFSLELADIPIEVTSRYNYCRWFCRDYLTDKEPVFSVFAGEDRMAEMREYDADIEEIFLERDAIYSAIASKLPYFRRVILHGACISWRGKGYLFTAASGTGKSTHIGLWKQYLGADVDIVNGDKPIFHIMGPNEGGESEKEHGKRINSGGVSIMAYDTPWCGKEGWNRKHSAPMAAICFLRRSEDGLNRIRRVEPDEAIPLMLRQMFHPYEPEATGLMMEMLDQMLETLPLYLLECDISEDAVRCSFEALTGEQYVSKGIQYTREEIDRLWRMSVQERGMT